MKEGGEEEIQDVCIVTDEHTVIDLYKRDDVLCN
jgi:hypothetical protein